MKFTTQLELNITIMDQTALYSTDYDQMVLDHAKILYEGKCKNGQYIASVDKLIKRSLPKLNKRDLDAKVGVYAIVEVSAVHYDKSDAITGVKVQKIIQAGKIENTDIIICTANNITCIIRLPADTIKYNIGDIIPVRVRDSTYKISKSILIDAYPFVPYVPDQLTYYFIGKLSEDNKKHFNSKIMPLFKRELERKETMDKNRWEQFSKMLLPYKKMNTSMKNMIGITDIESMQNKVIYIDYTIDMSKMQIAVVNKPNVPKQEAIITSEVNDVLMRVSYEYIKWLELINNLVECYATDSEFEKAGYIWKLYEDNKL